MGAAVTALQAACTCAPTLRVRVNRRCLCRICSDSRDQRLTQRLFATDLLSIFGPYGNAVHTALSLHRSARTSSLPAQGRWHHGRHGGGPLWCRNVILTDVNEYRLIRCGSCRRFSRSTLPSRKSPRFMESSAFSRASMFAGDVGRPRTRMSSVK